jgi:hypothetical protein
LLVLDVRLVDGRIAERIHHDAVAIDLVFDIDPVGVVGVQLTSLRAQNRNKFS